MVTDTQTYKHTVQTDRTDCFTLAHVLGVTMIEWVYKLMHLSMASPTPPPPGLDGGIVGI